MALIPSRRPSLSTSQRLVTSRSIGKAVSSTGVRRADSFIQATRKPPVSLVPPRNAGTAISDAKALFVEGPGHQGTIGGTVTDYRKVTDTRFSEAAKTQLEQNRALEEKAVAVLSPGDQQRYRDVQAKLQTDSTAQLAMQTMLLEGRLPGAKDLREGKTLLEQLEGLSKQALAPDLAGGEKLLAQTVKEVFIPAAIAQGDRLTCGATSGLAALASATPAEYVRLVAGLASPAGSVVMANGEPLVREPGTLGDDGIDRSVSQRLLGPAAMEYANGIFAYDNANDRTALVFGGLSVGMEEHLLEGLFGRSFDSAQDLSMFMVGMLPNDRKAALAEQAIAAVDAGQSPVAVGMSWPTPDQGHFLVIDRVERTAEGTFVVLRNPWGQEERVPYADFEQHVYGVVQPEE